MNSAENEPIEVKIISAASDDGHTIVTPEKCERIRFFLTQARQAEQDRIVGILEEEKIGCENHSQMPPCLNPVHAYNKALSSAINQIKKNN